MSFGEFNRKFYGGVEAACSILFYFHVITLTLFNFPLGETRDLHENLIDVLSPLSQSETPVRLVVGLFKILKNRQYSYSPTVLGRVGLDHECEANAGNFSPRGQTNMKKLPLSLPNLRIIFNIVKFRRAYILERSLFQTTKGRSAHYY